MKKFTFRLERLLQLRERAERTQAAELGAAMRAESEQREALDRASAALDRAARDAAAPANGTFVAGAWLGLDFAKSAVAGQVEVEQQALAQAAELRTLEQARWQDARQERRTVEKLKERRFESWREEISRDDQKTIDGLTQNRRPNEGSPQ